MTGERKEGEERQENAARLTPKGKRAASSFSAPLNITLVGGFVPGANDRFDVITAGNGCTGTPSLPPGAPWTVTTSANSVTIKKA